MIVKPLASAWPSLRCGLSLCAVLLTSLGCSGSSEALHTATPQPVAAKGEAEQPVTDSGTRCQIEAEIAAAVRLRTLPVLAPIRCRILDRKVLGERALVTSLRDTPKPWLDGQTRWLQLLGFADEQFDLIPAVGSLLDEQLAGFYDPQQDMLFVASDMVDRSVLIHEIVHALQDQHFDLGKRMKEAKTSDALSALQILAEGDATSAMLEFRRDPAASEAAVEVMSQVGAFMAEATPTEVPVPAILKRALFAPYSDGFAVVERLRAHGDWDAVNAVWAKQPDSSAAVLSADSLILGNTVKYPVLPEPPPWRSGVPALYDDVTGEQSLRVMFEEWLSRSKAEQTAQGWLGDRLTVWIDQGHSALLWRLRWATPLDTQEALRAFAKGYFKGQADQLTAPPREVTSLTRGCDGTGSNPLALATRGQDIVLVAHSRSAGTTPEACERLVNWARAALN